MKNVTTIILAAFLVGALSLLFVAKRANTRLDKSLLSTRSQADSLLKQTESLDKSAKKFKGQSDSLAIKNQELQKTVAQSNSRLASKEREILKSNNEANKKWN